MTEKSNSEAYLNMIEGSLSAVINCTARVKNGTCSILTPNIQFSEIDFDESLVCVDTEDRSFEVEVDDSNIEAQNGTIGENQIEFQEPSPSGANTSQYQMMRMDWTEYEEQFSRDSCLQRRFISSVDYECPLGGKLGVAGRRLAVRNFAGLVKLVSADTNCGLKVTKFCKIFNRRRR